jgi:EAL domain-containing protein (putative c-di-GMP-specific phosphodiesterase class I)
VKIEQLAEVNAIIQSFRTRGFRFCLDDFGSGSASFDYLNALDVDIVKFDGPVVKRACSSQKGSDLLSAMAKMCASMGIRTAAEMVEDKRMAGRVYQCSVDFGQGWYFGKPDFDPFIYADRFMSGS